MFIVVGVAAIGCRAEVAAEPAHVECRNVEVRSRRDLEVCTTRCNDEGCHKRCHEHARYAHERHCWVE